MKFSDDSLKAIASACGQVSVDISHQALLQALKNTFPQLEFKHVLTRSGWYRTGGLYTPNGTRLAENLRDWLESECEGDLQLIFDKYADADLVVSTLAGQTHYFSAQLGDKPQDYVQLEIEEMQEVMDHVLFEDASLPDDIEDIVDPVGIEKLEPRALQPASYSFRRLIHIADYMQQFPAYNGEQGDNAPAILRFLDDWGRSSARESEPFCSHWVLGLQEYTDAYGEPVLRIKPITTFSERLPEIKLDDSHRGVELANLINHFDRAIGYPMAWYFFMLSHKDVPHEIAEAIHRDLMGAYDYLPARDLKVLNDWYAKPYAV